MIFTLLVGIFGISVSKEPDSLLKELHRLSVGEILYKHVYILVYYLIIFILFVSSIIITSLAKVNIIDTFYWVLGLLTILISFVADSRIFYGTLGLKLFGKRNFQTPISHQYTGIEGDKYCSNCDRIFNKINFCTKCGSKLEDIIIKDNSTKQLISDIRDDREINVKIIHTSESEIKDYGVVKKVKVSKIPTYHKATQYINHVNKVKIECSQCNETVKVTILPINNKSKAMYLSKFLVLEILLLFISGLILEIYYDTWWAFLIMVLILLIYSWIILTMSWLNPENDFIYPAAGDHNPEE